MNALGQVRALHVLAAARLGQPAYIEPVSSVTNEVWITPDHVVRINRKATGRLHREAMLAAALRPATVAEWTGWWCGASQACPSPGRGRQ